MKLRVFMFVAFGLGFGMMAWAAQTGSKKVNFSGTWILAKTQTDQAPAMQRGGGAMGRGRRLPGGGSPGGGRRGNIPGSIDLPQGALIVIRQTEGELAITRRIDRPGDGEREFTQVFKLDGNESVNPSSPGGGEIRSRTSWNKSKLMTLGTQTMPRGGAAADIVIMQEFSLSKDGKTLTLKTSRTIARGKITSKDTYTRQNTQ
jgi:hypothetical protein